MEMLGEPSPRPAHGGFVLSWHPSALCWNSLLSFQGWSLLCGWQQVAPDVWCHFPPLGIWVQFSLLLSWSPDLRSFLLGHALKNSYSTILHRKLNVCLGGEQRSVQSPRHPASAGRGCVREAHEADEDGQRDADKASAAARAKLTMPLLFGGGLPCSGSCRSSCSALVNGGGQVLRI